MPIQRKREIFQKQLNGDRGANQFKPISAVLNPVFPDLAQKGGLLPDSLDFSRSVFILQQPGPASDHDPARKCDAN
jgi:hypothetical protein